MALWTHNPSLRVRHHFRLRNFRPLSAVFGHDHYRRLRMTSIDGASRFVTKPPGYAARMASACAASAFNGSGLLLSTSRPSSSNTPPSARTERAATCLMRTALMPLPRASSGCSVRLLQHHSSKLAHPRHPNAGGFLLCAATACAFMSSIRPRTSWKTHAQWRG